MQAVILAGGLGTRLRGVIGEFPKPMADISGKPFLEYLLNVLRASGVVNVLLLVGYKHEIIQNYFGDGSWLGLNLKYVVERSPLGTGGALLNAFDELEDEFLLLNGDTFFDVQYELISDFLRTRKVDALVVLRYSMDVERYGFVEINDENIVVNFFEKGGLPEGRVDGYINGGIYYFKKEVFKRFLPFRGEVISLEKDILPTLARDGLLIGLPTGGKFIDIGVPEDYEKAKNLIPLWLSKERLPAVFIDRDGTIIEDPGYVQGTDLKFKEETIELMKREKEQGKLLIIISNQAGIAKGKFTEEESRRTTEFVISFLKSRGVYVDAYYYCPYHSDGVIEKYRKVSLARKPEPGMILQACEDFRINLIESEIIGDNPLVDRIKLFGPRVRILGD